MPRRLRIEFEGAIYHVMTRGNARQKIVRDDADRRRLIDGLEQSVVRHGWDLLCYVVMGNHLHLMVKTPHPNLGAGCRAFSQAMQSGRGDGGGEWATCSKGGIFAAVTSFYGLDDAALSRRHDPHVARAVAAWLCRRHTEASLRELAARLGLSRPDSVPNLTRRIETRLKASPELSNDLTEILKRANSPDVGVHQDNAKRTKTSRKSARSKTKNQG